MNKFLVSVIAAAVIGCSMCGSYIMAQSDIDSGDEETIDPIDIEIINDLEMFQNWDDVQNAKAFDEKDDQSTTGADHDA